MKNYIRPPAAAKIINWAWSDSDKHKNTDYNNEDIILLDAFDTSDTTVRGWLQKNKLVAGYISVGSWEDWRDDKDDWDKDTIGDEMGWPGEKWVKVREWKKLKPIMSNRFKMMKDKGFQAVEYDNIMMFEPSHNQGTSRHKDVIAYAKWLAEESHKYGLAAFMKNGSESNGIVLAEKVEPYMDGLILEEALGWGSMDDFKEYKGKPIWLFEYNKEVKRKQYGSDVEDSDLEGAWSDTDELEDEIKNNPSKFKDWCTQVFYDNGKEWRVMWETGEKAEVLPEKIELVDIKIDGGWSSWSSWSSCKDGMKTMKTLL